MKNFYIFSLCLVSGWCMADISSHLNVCTQDLTVSNWPYQLRVTNGSLTDNGDGTMSLASGSGGSSSLFISTGSATRSTIVTSSATNIVFDTQTFIGALQGTTTFFAQLNSSSVTLQGPIVSSVAINSITPGQVNAGIYGISVSTAQYLNDQVSLSSGVTGSLPVVSIASGSLGVNVIASSIAVSAVGPTQTTGIDILASAQTYTAPKTWTSSGTFNGTITLSSGITLSGAAGTSGYVLTSKGANTVPVWSSGVVAGQYPGTQTNDNATVGNVGEYVSSAVVANSSFPTTAVWGDAAAISLTAGDWDVTGVVYMTINGATMVYAAMGISQNAGSSATGLQLGTNWLFFLPPTATSDTSASIPAYRQLLASPTTIYLKILASYSVADPKYQCRLTARRIR